MLPSSLMSNAVGEAEVSMSDGKAGVARTVRVELRRSGYAEMRRVEVGLEDDVLTLAGVVYSFHMKQLAQELARKAVSDVKIENRLTVVSTPRQRPK